MANRNTPKVTTTVTPSPLPGKRASSLARSHAPLSRVQVTPEIMKNNPELAARVISDLQESALRSSEGSRSSPFNFSYIAQKQKLTDGVQTNIIHNLGIAWAYVFSVHAYPGSGLLLQLTEAATMPSGLDKTKCCSFVPSIRAVTLLTAGSGIYDLVIVGQ